MLVQIARFEFRYHLRNPLLWVTAACTFALFFLSISAGFELGSEGGLYENAAYATLRNYLMISVLFMFVTTSFVANVIIRDDETGFGPIVRATRITRFEYLIGRFLGAFAIAALCLALVPAAIILGSLMPWADPASIGPNRLADHLYAYFLLALPNVLIHSAVFFALATLTRSMMATYLGVITFVFGFFVLQGSYMDQPHLEKIVPLLDAFGSRALLDATRYWTIAERNVMLPDFAGPLLYNRLIWVGVALGFLWLAYAGFRFADQGATRRQRKKQRLEERAASAPPPMAAAMALPAPQHGHAAMRALLWMRTRFEIKQVMLSASFPVLMGWGLFTTLFVLITQRDPDGKPSYPTTLSMIPEIEDSFRLIPLIIAIFYAGELVWRERSRRMHEMIDSAPMPNWGYVVSKTLAMAVVLMAALLTTVVASVVVQLSLGYTDLQLGKYLLWYVLPRTWDMLLLAAVAVFVQSISSHKAVGWGIMVLFLAWQELNASLNIIDHNLLIYGGMPPVPLSDLNGAGSFWQGAWTFRVYWGAFALLLLVGAHLLWRRGTEIRLNPRLARARWGLFAAPGRVAGAALLMFVLTGAYAFYNTNILNGYRSPEAIEEDMVDFERRYWKYRGLPQPSIAHVTLEVDLYPEERRAETKGRFRLRNLTSQSIPDIHIYSLEGDIELLDAGIEGARLISNDTRHTYRIYRLESPMRPGEERVLTFETRRRLRGFRNGTPEMRLVENGTFLGEAELVPIVGMKYGGVIQDSTKRRKYGLPELAPPPKLEDLSATARPTNGAGWGTVDITVSTTADQTPLAPGNKVSDVTRDGRRIARFVSEVPVRTRFAVLSARYAEKHRKHRGIDLAVYYHPPHEWNVDRMLDAMEASIDYYQANYGPYQFDHFRIVEFPGYYDFAQALAGTIPYSEEVGFVSDFNDPETLDYVTGMTAHEMAHQYWAYQVAAAEMEGAGVLSETLAQYSAHMVTRSIHGEDQNRRYLQYELDKYLSGRAWSSKEPPLARAIGQDHILYRKGSLAMYLLQERLGEDAVNRALRNLLEEYKFKGPPYARSLDLIEALRAEAKTADEQALITDLFERVTLYDLKVTEPRAVQRADGRWDVSVPVEAKKWYVEENGVETETPLAESIEVGLFTAEPGRDVFDQSDVVLLGRSPIRSGRQVLKFVTDKKPSHAGVDPYNLYIDRNSADNVLPVD